MKLDHEDAVAIAAEVVRQIDLRQLAEVLAPLIVCQLRAAESRQMDAEFFASLPEAERKRITAGQIAELKRVQKIKGFKK